MKLLTSWHAKLIRHEADCKELRSASKLLPFPTPADLKVLVQYVKYGKPA